MVKAQIDQASSDGPENRFNALTDRELQIATLITECYRPDEIATRLAISLKSVNSYRLRIYDKLGVQGDVELTLLALRSNIITTESFSDSDIDRLSRDAADESDTSEEKE